MKASFLAASLLLALSLPAAEPATKKVSDKKLSDFKIGEIISGDKIEPKALEGKVVALEFWGRNCGPCLAMMPHLSDMDKKWGKKGLQIIGIHAQEGTDEEILAVVKDKRLKFPIARDGHAAVSFDTIPRMFVFNPKGELVFEGNPAADDPEKVIRRELKSVTDTAGTGPGTSTSTAPAAPLIAERSWTSTDGRAMVATLLSVDGDSGKFKRKDGVAFTLALTKLSDADQKLIADTKAKQADDAK